jgi:hypothetical protein
MYILVCKFLTGDRKTKYSELNSESYTNFCIFLNTILIWHCATFSLISGHYITILSCTLVTEHEHAFGLFKMLTDNMGSLSP